MRQRARIIAVAIMAGAVLWMNPAGADHQCYDAVEGRSFPCVHETTTVPPTTTTTTVPPTTTTTTTTVPPTTTTTTTRPRNTTTRPRNTTSTPAPTTTQAPTTASIQVADTPTDTSEPGASAPPTTDAQPAVVIPGAISTTTTTTAAAVAVTPTAGGPNNVTLAASDRATQEGRGASFWILILGVNGLVLAAAAYQGLIRRSSRDLPPPTATV